MPNITIEEQLIAVLDATIEMVKEGECTALSLAVATDGASDAMLVVSSREDAILLLGEMGALSHRMSEIVNDCNSELAEYVDNRDDDYD